MKKKGFTLVELLVTISILSILSIVTVSQFNTARKKARDVARKGDLNAVAKALQMYYADYGVFPKASTNGEIETDAPINWGSPFVDRGYTYMATLPEEKYLTDTPYCYQVDADQKKFALYAQLENTEDGECRDANDDDVGDYSCDAKSYCYNYHSANVSDDELIDGTLD